MCNAKRHVRFTPKADIDATGYLPDKSNSRTSTVEKPSLPILVVIPAWRNSWPAF
jgi:hypothetical protein